MLRASGCKRRWSLQQQRQRWYGTFQVDLAQEGETSSEAVGNIQALPSEAGAKVYALPSHVGGSPHALSGEAGGKVHALPGEAGGRLGSLGGHAGHAVDGTADRVTSQSAGQTTEGQRSQERAGRGLEVGGEGEH